MLESLNAPETSAPILDTRVPLVEQPLPPLDEAFLKTPGSMGSSCFPRGRKRKAPFQHQVQLVQPLPQRSLEERSAQPDGSYALSVLSTPVSTDIPMWRRGPSPTGSSPPSSWQPEVAEPHPQKEARPGLLTSEPSSNETGAAVSRFELRYYSSVKKGSHQDRYSPPLTDHQLAEKARHDGNLVVALYQRAFACSQEKGTEMCFFIFLTFCRSARPTLVIFNFKYDG